MPTINQLVRKPRKPVVKKTKAPALRFTYNSLKGKLTAAADHHKARRLHKGDDNDAEEAKLGAAQDRPRAALQRP